MDRSNHFSNSLATLDRLSPRRHASSGSSLPPSYLSQTSNSINSSRPASSFVSDATLDQSGKSACPPPSINTTRSIASTQVHATKLEKVNTKPHAIAYLLAMVNFLLAGVSFAAAAVSIIIMGMTAVSWNFIQDQSFGGHGSVTISYKTSNATAHADQWIHDNMWYQPEFLSMNALFALLAASLVSMIGCLVAGGLSFRAQKETCFNGQTVSRHSHSPMACTLIGMGLFIVTLIATVYSRELYMGAGDESHAFNPKYLSSHTLNDSADTTVSSINDGKFHAFTSSSTASGDMTVTTATPTSSFVNAHSSVSGDMTVTTATPTSSFVNAHSSVATAVSGSNSYTPTYISEIMYNSPIQYNPVSWNCRLSTFADDAATYRDACNQNKAAAGFMVVLLLLQLGMIGVHGYSWRAQSKHRKQDPQDQFDEDYNVSSASASRAESLKLFSRLPGYKEVMNADSPRK